MDTLHVLVDYYNQAGLPSHRQATFADHEAGVQSIVMGFLRGLDVLDASPRSARFRFYGGWFEKDATDDRQALGAVLRKNFPTRLTKQLRALGETADAIVAAPGATLTDTVRPLPGLVPFRIQRPTTPCPVARCALDDLDFWRRGVCPLHNACKWKTDDVTVARRQKLVDTMIVADAIVLAQDADSGVVVISNDDDIIPGVVTAALSSSVWLLRLGRLRSSPYDEFLHERKLLPLES